MLFVIDVGAEYADDMATLIIGSKEFELQLEDNATVDELARHSPITLTVDDYGGKEKVGSLPVAIRAGQSYAPRRVKAGDVFVYGSDSLVIFYTPGTNSWGGYRAVGTLFDAGALEEFIGSGAETVTLAFD